MNDFGFPLKRPNHPRYLNTEFIGHTYVTKPYDSGERLTEHTLRHARVYTISSAPTSNMRAGSAGAHSITTPTPILVLQISAASGIQQQRERAPVQCAQEPRPWWRRSPI